MPELVLVAAMLVVAVVDTTSVTVTDPKPIGKETVEDAVEDVVLMFAEELDDERVDALEWTDEDDDVDDFERGDEAEGVWELDVEEGGGFEVVVLGETACSGGREGVDVTGSESATGESTVTWTKSNQNCRPRLVMVSV